MDRLGSAKSKWTWPPAAGKGAGGGAGVALELHDGEMVQTKAKWAKSEFCGQQSDFVSGKSKNTFNN